jgi:hypothetical protein
MRRNQYTEQNTNGGNAHSFQLHHHQRQKKEVEDEEDDEKD